MPLSDPAERKLLHERDITLRGYERADGLFDIEARLTDRKTYGFSNDDRGRIEAGDNLHGMRLRMTVNLDLLIVACEAVTEQGPFAICPSGAETFSGLAGLSIKSGFLKAANAIVGGVAGCTHLRELLQQVATTAFQTVGPVRWRQEAAERERLSQAAEASRETQTGNPPPQNNENNPRLLNTCYAYGSDNAVVQRRWPHLYTGKASS